MAEIPEQEYRDRVDTLQEKLQDCGLDAYLVYSNEADFANVRYLSNYWPLFEVAAVLVPAEGEATLLVGPESEAYAEGRSTIDRIRKLVCLRESAEPEYPGIEVSNFESVFEETCGSAKVERVGLGSHAIFPQHVYAELRDALPNAELIWAEEVISDMRAIKSQNEIDCLREAARISQKAVDEVLPTLEPGVTELQVVGKVLEVLYREGAEYEGLPQYILAGENAAGAISRATHRRIEEGDPFLFGTSARVCGYSSSVQRPACMGKMSPQIRDMVQFGFKAHNKTAEMMEAGVPASEVAIEYEEWVKEQGYADKMLYGPCHGTGLIEVERPWMETSSDYDLKPNMTFQVDTFFHTPEFGARWEDGVRITEDGVDKFTWADEPIIELM
jgi:Xaa-Pro aminopeptidase